MDTQIASNNSSKKTNKRLGIVVAWFIRTMMKENSFVYQNIEVIIQEYAKYPWEILYADSLKYSDMFTCVTTVLGGQINFSGAVNGPNAGWCVSSIGFNEGIHIWKIKCITATFDSIGIITNVGGFVQARNWPFDEKKSGITYQFLNNITYPNYEYGGIYEYQSSKTTKHKPIQVKWQTNDIIEVMVNCITWKLSYFINSENIANINIIQNQTYYPAFAFRDNAVYEFNCLNHETDLFAL
eukprot:528645_1